jgi:glycosyltransferase involved in cell wall biosynthesis
MSEIIVDGVTGLLVPPEDDTTLAAALIRLCEDGALRRAWGANGRERVLSHFRWSQVVDRLLPILARAVNPHP